MTIVLNGEDRAIGVGTTVAQLVRDVTGEGERGIAVAVNDTVVPRGAWASAVLDDGDRVEMLNAVPGG